MKPSARQTHWDRVFETKAETSLSWYEAAPQTSLAWIAALDLDRKAPIVDVGTGVSRLPDRLLALGYTDITLVDVSQAAIAVGNRRRVAAGLGSAEGCPAFIGDVTAWRPERRFRLWHDRAVLHFLTTDEEALAYRRVLKAALVEGGYALIATFAPDGPERCSGLAVRRYGPEELAAWAGPAFAVEASRTLDHVTPSGALQRFHWCLLRRE